MRKIVCLGIPSNKEYVDDWGFDLYYYGARFMDPNTGRFITPDPVQDYINQYSYVGNNPVNRIDPTGMLGLPSFNYGSATGYDYGGNPFWWMNEETWRERYNSGFGGINLEGILREQKEIRDAKKKELGRMLTEYCLEIAGKWHLRRVVAVTITDNRAMLADFEKPGSEFNFETGDNTVEVWKAIG